MSSSCEADGKCGHPAVSGGQVLRKFYLLTLAFTFQPSPPSPCPRLSSWCSEISPSGLSQFFECFELGERCWPSQSWPLCLGVGSLVTGSLLSLPAWSLHNPLLGQRPSGLQGTQGCAPWNRDGKEAWMPACLVGDAWAQLFLRHHVLGARLPL